AMAWVLKARSRRRVGLRNAMFVGFEVFEQMCNVGWSGAGVISGREECRTFVENCVDVDEKSDADNQSTVIGVDRVQPFWLRSDQATGARIAKIPGHTKVFTDNHWAWAWSAIGLSEDSSPVNCDVEVMVFLVKVNVSGDGNWEAGLHLLQLKDKWTCVTAQSHCRCRVPVSSSSKLLWSKDTVPPKVLLSGSDDSSVQRHQNSREDVPINKGYMYAANAVMANVVSDFESVRHPPSPWSTLVACGRRSPARSC
ncbi:357_t:CDS:2, partial [Scutellospora calospora]